MYLAKHEILAVRMKHNLFKVQKSIQLSIFVNATSSLWMLHHNCVRNLTQYNQAENSSFDIIHLQNKMFEQEHL